MRRKAAQQRAAFGERRATDRFPIDRTVRYRVFDGKSVMRTGDGRTVDMSSAGIRFEADTPLPVGKRIELSVDWPAKLNDTCRLKLVAVGRIVRTDGASAVILFNKHEFRTQGSSGLSTS